MGFDDEGPMSPSSLQLSDVAAESIVFSWQYPRIGGKVVLLLVHAPHPTRIHHIITIPSLHLCITMCTLVLEEPTFAGFVQVSPCDISHPFLESG